MSSSTESDIPWVEKYRPTSIDDIVGNEEAVDRLRVIATEGNMPNLILSGPPGTGKTTSILCLAHALLGPTYKDAVLELNASDDRGLTVVREKIKMFAQKKVTLPPGRHKIVILDEADSMTGDAQQALRRTMEVYSHTTRFALACNTSTKIIEPIQSRCAILRYTRLSDTQVLKRVLEVADVEKVTMTDEGLEAVLFVAEGDLRTALNSIQSTVSGFGIVNPDNLFKVCDQPHPMVVKEIIDACASRDFDRAHSRLDFLITKGYSAPDIISTFFKCVRSSAELDERTQLDYVKEIGVTHMRIVEGVASPLQLSSLIARLCRA